MCKNTSKINTIRKFSNFTIVKKFKNSKKHKTVELFFDILRFGIVEQLININTYY